MAGLSGGGVVVVPLPPALSINQGRHLETPLKYQVATNKEPAFLLYRLSKAYISYSTVIWYYISSIVYGTNKNPWDRAKKNLRRLSIKVFLKKAEQIVIAALRLLQHRCHRPGGVKGCTVNSITFTTDPCTWSHSNNNGKCSMAQTHCCLRNKPWKSYSSLKLRTVLQ